LVSTSPVDSAPQVRAFDADALGRGVAHEPEGRSVELAACDRPFGQQVVIVDPAGGSPCAAGEVGEIWVRGPNVARGYWGDPRRTAQTFGATLSDGSGPWLRTGDLGVFCEEDLYVTGRLKDLVIVDGRNHYPQDIEATVHAAHPGVRPGKVAVFAVPAQDTERLVVVVESTVDTDPDDIARAVRAAVRREHGLRVHDVVVAGRGAVHRTSSGKLARHATREWFLSSRGNPVESAVTG
jgi:fatty acid CoA ligase FadD32